MIPGSSVLITAWSRCDYTSMYYSIQIQCINVQVRAKTSAAEGRWSELVPLGKFYIVILKVQVTTQLNALFHVCHAGCRNTEKVPLTLYV